MNVRFSLEIKGKECLFVTYEILRFLSQKGNKYKDDVLLEADERSLLLIIYQQAIILTTMGKKLF